MVRSVPKPVIIEENKSVTTGPQERMRRMLNLGLFLHRASEFILLLPIYAAAR
jgi:hypothetical protein